jgi:hypothetical protein
MRRFMRHEVLYSNEVYELDSALSTAEVSVWVDDSIGRENDKCFGTQQTIHVRD